ncbi:carbon-nitrogen family hydrolase [Sediminibacillus massiliensis]|uniref:carbon-nitrogen family hydrolase n=1 Tax=Sediminibacillus massiliensis TaxID=1926277 RepID=UPI00098834F8|nr:carbon-nitrogen family hydrolase [Sediminibacillus massiliensis]
MKIRIALIQMDITFGQPARNKEKVIEKVREAARKKVDIIVLPELWTTGYDLSRIDEIADQANESIDLISKLAKQYQINIVGGSIAKKGPEGVTNTLFVINRQGMLVKDYNKVHLFRLMKEEKYLIEGSDDGLFSLEGIPSAGVICYDIRFPEWIRTHMLANTKMLFVVAEWPEPRIDHWRALLVSRAIENQCFVIGCNRTGEDPANKFGGRSLIVGPWGEMIEEADNSETILYGEIDLADVDKTRSAIPVFTDRRPDLYRY